MAVLAAVATGGVSVVLTLPHASFAGCLKTYVVLAAASMPCDRWQQVCAQESCVRLHTAHRLVNRQRQCVAVAGVSAGWFAAVVGAFQPSRRVCWMSAAGAVQRTATATWLFLPLAPQLKRRPLI